ncbi:MULTISPECIES: hypothetical protein [unclassified Rhizobium]|uniref:hypothetical protein n=1 Tax=unclassified Rhizobium TaxID=2613769 RepID=UPI0007EAF6AD|nr:MULTISPECIES: hypothetical protein [unclassified Rhizobium]ANM12128.1 hypothetical protein AMK05_CH03781 [Rhizobium sp. N324]ANM18531.1 hypothetical protein AMK06_CH03668 [Rhizobium sp. N541]ANM24917.1 hypothetical protein AMK07_CH03666 [Rhizobium sp. N941]OYD05644.1 hypothetical protein AMK08_CH103711 [Rhizobium sp. N4311]
MQVATTSASIILRGTSSTTAISAALDDTDQGVLKLQRSTQTLQQMRQTSANSEDEAKTKAQRKLEEAKQQLEMLRSSSMPPEVVARLAAELARKVGTAASEFASSVAADSPAAVASVDATTDATAATTEAALTDASGKTAVEEAGAQEPDAAASARKAYQSVAEDAPRFSGISVDDRETMEEFKAVVRDLKQLLEKAMHDLRQQNRQTGVNAIPDAAGFSIATATIPTSIVV